MEKVKAVLDTEAPVAESLLVKRVLQSCGLNKVSSKIQAQNEIIFRKLEVKRSEQDGVRFLWKAEQTPDDYTRFRMTGEGVHKRDAKDIPQQETANAVCAVLDEKGPMVKADLLRETAIKLGYNRLGVLVLTAMERGVNWAEKNGRIVVDKADNVKKIT